MAYYHKLYGEIIRSAENNWFETCAPVLKIETFYADEIQMQYFIKDTFFEDMSSDANRNINKFVISVRKYLENKIEALKAVKPVYPGPCTDIFGNLDPEAAGRYTRKYEGWLFKYSNLTDFASDTISFKLGYRIKNMDDRYIFIYITKHKIPISAGSFVQKNIVDWREPIFDLWRRKSTAKRDFTNFELLEAIEIDIEAMENDESGITNYEISDSKQIDRLITEKINKDRLKTNVHDIISTIDDEQFKIMSEDSRQNIVVCGCAGSGKTMVLTHKLARVLYQNKHIFNANSTYIVSPNESLKQQLLELDKQLDIDKVTFDGKYKFNKIILQKITRKNLKELGMTSGENFFNDFIFEDTKLKEYLSNYNDIIFGNNIHLANDFFAYLVRTFKFKIKKYLEEKKLFKHGIFEYNCSGISLFLDRTEMLFDELNLSSLDDEQIKKINSDKWYKNIFDIFFSVDTTFSRNNLEFYRLETRYCIKHEYVTMFNINNKKGINFLKFFDKFYLLNKQFLKFFNKENPGKKEENPLVCLVKHYLILLTQNLKINEQTIDKKKINIDYCLTIIDYLLNKSNDWKIKKDPFTYLYLLVNNAAYSFCAESEHDVLFCIDEMQGFSEQEIQTYLKCFKAPSYFYLFGDFQQSISPFSLPEQSSILKNFKRFNLTKNYRNSSNITNYVVENLSINMEAKGPQENKVEIMNLSNFIQKIKNENHFKKYRTVIIYTNKEEEAEIRKYIPKYLQLNGKVKITIGNIYITTINGVQGLEFDIAYVFNKNMSRNECYVAYTRALHELYLSHE